MSTSFDEAARDWQYEVDETAARLVEAGEAPWTASIKAVDVVRKRRRRDALREAAERAVKSGKALREAVRRALRGDTQQRPKASRLREWCRFFRDPLF